MKNINKILAVSVIAMLAVPAAQAKIVSETMLSSEAGHYSGTHTVQSEIDAKATKATTLSGYGITDAYTKTETGTQITNAVNALDSTSTGTGTVVKGVSQENGKVSVTVGTIANADVASNAAIAGTKIAAATNSARGTIEIATDEEATTGTSETLAVNPKQLKAAAAAAQAAATPGIATTSATGVVKGGGNVAIANDGTMSVDLSGKADKATTLSGYGITDAYTKTETGTQITNAVNALDSTSTGTGNVVVGVSQTNGKVTVTKGSIAESDVTNLTTDLAAKEDNTNKVTSTDNISDTDRASTTKYPSMAATTAMINKNTETITESIDDLAAAKQPKSTAAYQMGNATGGWTQMTSAQQNALNSGATTAKINQIATNTTNITNNANKIGSGTISAKGANGTDAAADLVAAVNAIDGRLASATSTASNAVAKTSHTKNTTLSVKSDGSVVDGTVSGSNGISASVNDSGNITVSGNNASTTAKGVMQVGSDLTVSSGTVSVDKATTVANGNTKPVTSGAVYTAVNAKQDKLGGTAGKLVVTTATAGTVAYTDAVPTSIPATPSKDGVFVLTAKNDNGTTTFYWEDIGR